jgi:hypothetical protein
MDLLERIFGVETMARAREAAREAQARANATFASLPASVAPRVVAPLAPAAPRPRSPRAGPGANVRASFDDSSPDFPAADFPTSILGTAEVARPPLLAAYASRDALLAAIVYSEALAPPIALR